MATTLDPKQIVSFEELLMSQVVQQEALTRLLIEEGIFAKDKFMGMVKLVDQEMRSKRGRAGFADLIYLDHRTRAQLWGKRP